MSLVPTALMPPRSASWWVIAFVRKPLCGIEDQNSGHNIAPDLSVTVDVGFCQIGKWANRILLNTSNTVL
jgi:hypothetical protein